MPGILRAGHLLPELQSFPRPRNPRFHAPHARHYPRKAFLYARALLGTDLRQKTKNAGCITAVPRENLPRIRSLKLAHPVRVEIVKSHVGERVVNRTKLRLARSRNKVEAIRRDRRERIHLAARRARSVGTDARLHSKTDIFRAFKNTLLCLDLEARLWPGSDPESVVAWRAIRKNEFQPHPEMCWVAAAPAPDLVDSAPVAERMVERGSERVRHEPKRIQKVTLAGAVRADQKGQPSEFHVARGNALVVLDHHAAQKRDGAHGSDFAWAGIWPKL